MADDEIEDPEFEVEDLEEVLAAEDLDDGEIDADLVEDVIDGEDVLVEDDEEEDEALDPAARAKRDDEDEDDEELNPDDVEADLDTILKDRIAAVDDEEEEDEEVVVEAKTPTEVAEGVTPRRANEFTCTGCFLLVNRGQFGPAGSLTCPVGEADCPAIREIEAGERQPARAGARSASARKPTSSAGAGQAQRKAPAKKAPAKKASSKKAPGKS